MRQTSFKHVKKPFPKIRYATIDLLKAARQKNIVHSMIEVDITNVRNELKSLKRNRNSCISFTGYIIYCIAKAVDSNKHMHAYRNVKNQLVLYDDVDVSTTIERAVDGSNQVVPMIIRKANFKSVEEISGELKNEKASKVAEAEVFRSMNIFLSIPAYFRQLVFRLMDRCPSMMKKWAGTIMVTSANMLGKGAGWGVPIASHTLNVTIGSIVERIVKSNHAFVTKEHLCLTISFDHDIIDGAPAARFIRSMKKVIENGHSDYNPEPASLAHHRATEVEVFNKNDATANLV